MTNRDLINLLMNQPLDAEVSIDCKCCAHGTLYSGNSAPDIRCSGGTYKTLTISTNGGFENESLNLKHVTDEKLLREVGKRMKKD